MQKNPVCLWEIGTNDTGSVRDFLKQVFEWEINAAPDHEAEYHEIKTDGSSNGFYGGLFFKVPEDIPPYLTVYIQVEDIEAKAKEIVEAGGTILRGPFLVGEGGKFCFFKEPQGQMLAMVQWKKSET